MTGEVTPKESSVKSSEIKLRPEDLRLLSNNIITVINQKFNEHAEWLQQWYNWTNNAMMQMQPIPPQAYMDFDMQSQRLFLFVTSFKPTSEILKKSGLPELATLIANTEEGAKKTQESFQAAQKEMNTNNMNSQKKIWEMNKKTNQEILGMQRDTSQKRAESFDRSNKAFLDYLRS